MYRLIRKLAWLEIIWFGHYFTSPSLKLWMHHSSRLHTKKCYGSISTESKYLRAVCRTVSACRTGAKVYSLKSRGSVGYSWISSRKQHKSHGYSSYMWSKKTLVQSQLFPSVLLSLAIRWLGESWEPAYLKLYNVSTLTQKKIKLSCSAWGNYLLK